MIILTLKTDCPEAELSLYDDQVSLQHITWTAHRQLAETIHLKIAELLKATNKDWSGIEGIVCFKGPGSFTGLRIGMSTANAIAYGVNGAVVSEGSSGWQEAGIARLLAGENETTAMPEYGSEPHITKARK
jgi:tRNA threonylcarbamoyladenosine biosynthesis protein TsaB